MVNSVLVNNKNINELLIKGSSSLLFIISTIKAFNCSRLILWKYSNLFLIVASFLCNATEYKPIFLLFDYLGIYIVSVSYINISYINIIYSLLLLYEYKKNNSIETIKNIAFLTAILKSIVYTYLYLDIFYYNIIIISSILGITIYRIRYLLHKKRINHNYIILLTYLFHICIMNILYISSITAI